MASSSSSSTTPPPNTAAEAPPFPVMQTASELAAPIKYTSIGGEGNDKVIESVPTKMNYVTKDTQEINIYRDISGNDSNYVGAQWDPVDVPIENARLYNEPPTLTKNGYELVNVPVIEEEEEIDYFDTHQVIHKYYPQCEKLLKDALGSKAVCIQAFDHNVRKSSTTWGESLKGSDTAKAQLPLGMVHGDYTKESGPNRLIDLAKPPKVNDVLRTKLGDTPLLDPAMVQEAVEKQGNDPPNQKKKRRFAIINVWRNIDRNHPVEEYPLACMDSTTFVPEEDLKILKIHYQDRIGQNYFCSYNPQHKWGYYPNMVYNEALLIKTWDSYGSFAISEGTMAASNHNYCSTMSIHSAFMDPTSPETRHPRQSIEVRCAIIYEAE